MKSIVLLFGAGASFGAGGIVPEQPPLGGSMYRHLAKSYPASWGRLPDDVRSAFEQDFESGMGIVYQRFDTAVPALIREMALFFVQFKPWQQSTLNCRLVRDLKRHQLLRKTIFSTLNYECVLEFSLAGQGEKIGYFAEGDESEVPVWKLHGSCNMFFRAYRQARESFTTLGLRGREGSKQLVIRMSFSSVASRKPH